jgi:hypothetical protein
MFTIYSAPTHLYTDTVTPCTILHTGSDTSVGLLLYAAGQCQVLGQWGSKHVAACILKRYCHCKEVRWLLVTLQQFNCNAWNGKCQKPNSRSVSAKVHRHLWNQTVPLPYIRRPAPAPVPGQMSPDRTFISYMIAVHLKIYTPPRLRYAGGLFPFPANISYHLFCRFLEPSAYTK